MGAPLSADSSPYCRLTSFNVVGNVITGTVEVGRETDGRSYKGSIGANATVTLLGAKSLEDTFSEIGVVSVSDDGSLSLVKPADCAFFKIRIDIAEIVK